MTVESGTSAKSAPSAATCRAVIADLQRLWFGETTRDEFRVRKVSAGRLAFALTANVYAKSRALDLLWNHGMWSESTPIVRQCFESALYAAWIQQHGLAGVPDMLAEIARQSDNLRQEIADAGVIVPEDINDAIVATRLHHDAIRQRTKHRPAVARRISDLRKMQDMCARMGGHWLYMLYRHLSSGVHALGPMNLHIVPGFDGQPDHVLEPVTGEREGDMLVAVTAYSMIWATRAWSELNVGKPAKKRLQSAGRTLGIPSLLTYEATPTPGAHKSSRRVVTVRTTS